MRPVIVVAISTDLIFIIVFLLSFLVNSRYVTDGEIMQVSDVNVGGGQIRECKE